MASADNEAIKAALAMLGAYWFILIAVLIFQIVVTWKVFEKAGKPGWASIVPFYQQYVLFELVGMKGWYIFLAFIPIVGAIIVSIMLIIAYYKLALCFGKSSGFGVGMIFLTFIFLAIIAFDDSKYKKPEIAE